MFGRGRLPFTKESLQGSLGAVQSASSLRNRCWCGLVHETKWARSHLLHVGGLRVVVRRRRR